MSYVPYPRGTLLVPSGPNGNHLFVVMNHACKSGTHIMFAITSIKIGIKHDPACEIQAGEHPFITHPSYVYYRDPQQRTTANFDKCVQAKLWTPREDIDQAIFDRICKGIGTSMFTKPWAEKYCRENGVI